MIGRASSIRRRLPLGALAVPLVVAAGGTPGCAKALFADKAPRTQFDTYDRVRQQYVAAEEPDVFGNPQPALRARLSQSR